MISNEQLSTWEQLSNDATEGPWYAYVKTEASVAIIKATDDDSDDGTNIRVTENRYYDAIASKNTFEDVCTYGDIEEKDLAFIAAAREAVPALIAEVRALKVEINRKTEKLNAERNRKTEKLNEEADWLARCLAVKDCPLGKCCCKYRHTKMQLINTYDDRCIKCWREKAKEWVGHD